MKTIVFELNETPWRVLDWYAARHPRSAFSRLLATAEAFTTVCDDAGELHPWVTWPTLHRGVGQAEHGIAHLGQDLRPVDETFPAVWRMLAREGLSVGVSGSLQSYPVPEAGETYAFYVPDTYALQPDTVPAELSRFQALNLRLTRRNSRNVSAKLGLGEALELGGEFARRGGRATTARRIIAQLAGEVSDRSRLNRRRGLQAAIGFDIFLRQLKARRPDFCTFFTNHVAAAMHRFWAAAFPEDYDELKLPAAWVEQYRGELAWAMGLADDFLRALMSFCEAHPGHRLLIVSSMGQAATRAETRDGYFSITRPHQFLAALGIEPDAVEVAAAMAPDLSVRLLTPDARARFAAVRPQLETAFPGIEIDVDDLGLAHVRMLVPKEDDGPLGPVRIGNRVLTPDEAGVGFVPDQDRVGTTAYHVPEGVLLSWRPGAPRRPERRRPRVSTLEVAPAILASYGLARPSYMAEPTFSL